MICCICGKDLPEESFYPSELKGHRKPRCKDCHKARKRRLNKLSEGIVQRGTHLIIRKDGPEYIVDVLEPHDPSRIDNLGKAKGFAEYARQNPGVGRIQLIKMKRDSVGKERPFRLDMSKSIIRDMISRCASIDELNHIFDDHGFFI